MSARRLAQIQAPAPGLGPPLQHQEDGDSSHTLILAIVIPCGEFQRPSCAGTCRRHFEFGSGLQLVCCCAPLTVPPSLLFTLRTRCQCKPIACTLAGVAIITAAIVAWLLVVRHRRSKSNAVPVQSVQSVQPVGTVAIDIKADASVKQQPKLEVKMKGWVAMRMPYPVGRRFTSSALACACHVH